MKTDTQRKIRENGRKSRAMLIRESWIESWSDSSSFFESQRIDESEIIAMIGRVDHDGDSIMEGFQP